MKEKILAELKKKFPGLQTEFLGFLANQLVANVTEENQIEGAITELNEKLPFDTWAGYFQSEMDRRVTTALEKHKKSAQRPAEPAQQPQTTEDDLDLKQLVVDLSNQFKTFQQKVTQEDLHGKLKGRLTEAKIPVKFAKKYTIEDESKLDEIFEEIKSDYDEIRQEFNNAAIGDMPKPGGANLPSKTINADIENWAKAKAATPAKQAS